MSGDWRLHQKMSALRDRRTTLGTLFPSRMRAVRHRRTTLGTFPYIQKGYFVEAMPKFRY